MYWNGQEVTSLNYRDIFSEQRGFSEDIRDEVRSALLDNIDISPIIEKYGKTVPDYIREVRLSTKVGVPKKYLRGIKNPKTLGYLRRLLEKNVDVSPFDTYLGMGLTETAEVTALSLIESSHDISKYDFSIIPEELLPFYKEGILLQKPIHLFNRLLPSVTPEYVREVLVLREKKVPVEEFLEEIWPIQTLKVLNKTNSPEAIEELLMYIYSTYPSEMVESLMEIQANNLPLEIFSAIDAYQEDPVPIYKPFQLDWVLQAFSENIDWEPMANPNLGNEELALYIREKRFDKGKAMKGRLRKHIE